MFEVAVAGLSHLEFLAGRDFPLNLTSASDLRNFIEGWVGRHYFLDHSGQTIDLEALGVLECEVGLENFTGKNYEKPLVIVARVAPKNTLKLTEGKDGSRPPAAPSKQGGGSLEWAGACVPAHFQKNTLCLELKETARPLVCLLNSGIRD